MSSLWNFALLLISLYLPGTVAADNATLIFSNTSFAGGAHITKPGCPAKCGDLMVNTTCSINPYFDINCNTSFDLTSFEPPPPPKAFLGSTELEVLGIFETKIRIKTQLAKQCYDQYGNITDSGMFWMDVSGSPFSFSNENKLTVVGCDDLSVMTKKVDDWADYVGCSAAVCSKPGDLNNGFCSGIGCCQASIPIGLQSIYIIMATLNAHTRVHNFSSCGYSFLAEQNSYTFNISDITDSDLFSRKLQTVPLVLDWAIGNQTYDQIRNTGEIICHGNSLCVDSGSILGGYCCNCSQGYQGNPYLSPGCHDINECEFDPCHEKAKCKNLPGTFNCSCPLNYFDDGTKNGTGCIYVRPPKNMALYAGVLLGLGLLLIPGLSFCLYKMHKMLKKRRIKQLKQNLFKRNGGLLLQQQISANDSVLEKMRIFTSKELEKATDRFNESRILGRAGQGTVYKGMLSDGRLIAVKMSKQVNQNQLEEFINEVIVLSQVNHRNVVKLLGCCLETEVPLLVYEFIPNGTLYHLIHDHDTGFPFTWDFRLRIAAEIANALAYLHHATSVPVYHRDMKSTNILLDEKYRAKLSDFGISRSVAIDQTHLTKKVKGTIGYLDPEYFRTGKFTEKSDVYSFGVVLVELLTGQKLIETRMTEEETSLVMRFLLAMEEDHLKTILDSQITEHSINEEHIAVCDLAKRCLKLNSKKRPTTREVASELERIKTSENPSSFESDSLDICSSEIESFVHIDDGSSWIHSDGSEITI